MISQNYRNGVQEWDEKLEQCPYYPSHQIRPTRFGHHLLQCRKALSKQPTSPYYHKIDDLVVCKFNSFHHIPRGRMEEHIKKCQGSVTVLKEKPFVPKIGTIDDGISNIMTGMDKLNAAGFDDDEDDWDDDTIQVPAYDPSARVDKYCILPAGLTPAERRNFRMEKRLCSNGSSENLSAENGSDENGSDDNGSDENGSDENGSVDIELNEAQYFI